MMSGKGSCSNSGRDGPAHTVEAAPPACQLFTVATMRPTRTAEIQRRANATAASDVEIPDGEDPTADPHHRPNKRGRLAQKRLMPRERPAGRAGGEKNSFT
jgi:hypothetical protein